MTASSKCARHCCKQPTLKLLYFKLLSIYISLKNMTKYLLENSKQESGIYHIQQCSCVNFCLVPHNSKNQNKIYVCKLDSTESLIYFNILCPNHAILLTSENITKLTVRLKVEVYKRETYLSIDIATKLKMEDVEQVTSMAMQKSHTKPGNAHAPFTCNKTL